LWSITVPLNESATVATSTLDWANTTYPIRGIAYNGTNGAAGSSGVNGTRTAILDVYQWSTIAPTTFPAGSSTYTWATGQFTAPATLNGWSLTPPAAVLGQVLWIARTLYADNNTTATTTVTWTASQANPVGASGVDGATGATGSAGANGARTAFLEVYQWAASAPTSYPSGTSTYTWADGSFTAPSTANGWSLTPGSSTPGYTLYGCSVRYADTSTTATTSVAWTTTTAYIVGYAGSNGATGSTGAAGSNGAATFVITRSANDSSAPTNSEVSSLLGRNPVAGDICTISYNSANNAVVYRYVTAWALFQTYITGSLIVQNTITGDKIAANTITASNIAANTITASNIAANTITAGQIAASTITGTEIAANTITVNEINNVATGQIIAGSFNFQPFTSVGSTTWTVPAYVYKLKITAVGGGGGGGRQASTNSSVGSGGGGGGALIKILAVNPGDVCNITIGAGGAGGANIGNSGTAGGNTVFVNGSTTLIANGGGGGAVGSNYGGIGGAGGTASGGDINIVGGKGQDGSANDLPSWVPASGGSSAFIGVTCAPGQSGSNNSGSGGGSQKTYGTAAGNGGSGLIIIEY
jgi:hypothetical protein